MKTNENQKMTIDIFEMAGIDMISGIKPDRFIVVPKEDGSGKYTAWGVYDDKSKLPKPVELKRLLQYSVYVKKMKELVFKTIELAVSDGAIKVSPKDDKKEEKKNG